METPITRRQAIATVAISSITLAPVATTCATELDSLQVAWGQTKDDSGVDSYRVTVLVVATDDLQPVPNTLVEVTLFGPDGGDGGYAVFYTDANGVAVLDKSLWPGRYQVCIRAPKESRYQDTSFTKQETMLVLLKDGRYSPREFRLAVRVNG